MNCLDFRRLCLIEPANREPRIYLHLYHCPACRAYRKRVLMSERSLTAVMHVPVPEGLDRKVVFDTEMQTRTKFFRLNWQALAASMILGVALGLGLFVVNAKTDVVPLLAMHIAEDPLHMSPPQADAGNQLDQVLRHLGLIWVGVKPEFTHAKVCLVREHAAAHLVVAGEQGPVTVFLVPKTKARDRHNKVVDGQIAEAAEMDGWSIALFGYQGENLAEIKERFRSGVKWSSVLTQHENPLIVLGY